MTTVRASDIHAGDYADALSTIHLAEQSFDEGNFDVHESLLHPDFAFTSPFGSFTAVGAYMDWLRSFYDSVSALGGTRHAVTNPIVRIDGDRATVFAYLIVLNRRSMTIMGTSTLEDVLVQHGGGWRFLSRSVSTDQAPHVTEASG